MAAAGPADGKCRRRGWRVRAGALLAAAWACAGVAQPRSGPEPAALQGVAPVARSGFQFMSRQTQAMQRDDTLNPGMLWVQDGLKTWGSRPAAGSSSCADCHGATPGERLAQAAARHPAWDEASGRPVNLGERVNLCRTRHQRAPAWAPDSATLLGLEAALGHAARGQAMSPPADPRLDPWRVRGQALWQQRMGQLNLSCAQCHDERAGARLGGSVIPPANAVGYPTYRLEWQTLGPLQRRLRNCLSGVRAEPFAPQGPEWVALELFLAWRDRGLPMEAPAVRP